MDHPQQPITPEVNGPTNTSKLLITLILVVIVAAGAFVGGMQYQKGKTGTSSSLASSQTSQSGFSQTGGPGGQAMNGSIGIVTAISSTSISVKDQRAGTTKTYSIASSTSFTNNGNSASYSDISVGDSVMVQTSSSTSTTATQVTVNPTMNGGPSGQQTSPTGATTQTN